MEWSKVMKLSHQTNHRGPSSLVQHRSGSPLLNRLLPRKEQYSASLSTHHAQNSCHNPCNSDTLHLDSSYIWLLNLFQYWFLVICVLLHCKVGLKVAFDNLHWHWPDFIGNTDVAYLQLRPIVWQHVGLQGSECQSVSLLDMKSHSDVGVSVHVKLNPQGRMFMKVKIVPQVNGLT